MRRVCLAWPTPSTPPPWIERFRQDLDLEDFRTDELVRAAVERKLEVVGEALNRLSREDPELAAGIPDIGRVIGFRNVLAHGYDIVDDEVVWDAITTDLPELAARVEAMLAELDAGKTPQPRLIPGTAPPLPHEYVGMVEASGVAPP